MTEIPYCDKTWNITGGCTKCSLGCQNCWAIPLAHRFAHNPVMGGYKGLVKDGNWTGEIKLFEDKLEQPLHYRDPQRIFVCSQSDLFHPKVPFEYIDKVFRIMARCHRHTFLVFTKRIENMRMYCNQPDIQTHTQHALWPLPNLQLFVSISTQKEADEKIPILLKIPATVKGVSLEPLLEETDLGPPSWHIEDYDDSLGYARYGFQQVIIGAESIRGRPGRPCNLEWVRNIVQQCQSAGVAVYVKQLILNGELVRDMSKFPPDLRVRDLVK